jgi:flagellar biosynthesis protein FlhG
MEHRAATPKVVAIASGKGGVGKSVLAANVGIFLAQLGRRVILIDASFGCPSLHSLTGASDGKYGLSAFLRREITRLEEALVTTPFDGLALLSGRNNGLSIASYARSASRRLLAELRAAPADYVILDLGPGTGNDVLDLYLFADLHLLVISSEPTAIEGAFRFARCAFARLIRSSERYQSLAEELQQACDHGVPTPLQLYLAAKNRSEQDALLLRAAIQSFRPQLIVNRARTRDDLLLGPSLAMISRRHLGLPVGYLGYIEEDDAVSVTVSRRRPLASEYPQAKVAKDIERVVRRIIAFEGLKPTDYRNVPIALEDRNHYDILGSHPGATDEELRRCYRQAKQVYNEQSRVVYGVLPAEQLKAMHRRLDVACATLLDPELRQAYNRTIFPEWQSTGITEIAGRTSGAAHGVTSPRNDAQEERRLGDDGDDGNDNLEIFLDPAALAHEAPGRAHQQLEKSEHPPQREAAAGADGSAPVEITGEFIRQTRTTRGLKLEDIARETKISVSYLQAIEAEQFSLAPAPVYLKGFVKAVARCLELNPERVATAYMERYYAHRSE